MGLETCLHKPSYVEQCRYLGSISLQDVSMQAEALIGCLEPGMHLSSSTKYGKVSIFQKVKCAIDVQEHSLSNLAL